MAGVATHLADKSALARVRHPDVAARIAPLLRSGVLATCSITDLEVLYSARDGREYKVWRADRACAYELIPIDQSTLNRAVEVQGVLAERGAHRGVSVPDLGPALRAFDTFAPWGAGSERLEPAVDAR